MSSPIDLSKLPAPNVVQSLDAAAIRDAMLVDLQTRDATFDALVASDPTYKNIEVVAWRETLIRQRVNDAARAVMLAYAQKEDLDQIGARYNVGRLLITPADLTAIPPVAAVYESDTDYRLRIQQSFEGFSVAGPVGAYKFFALSADADVLDVGVQSPSPAEVLITVLARSGTGAASTPLQDAVAAALSADNVRPIGDRVTVQSAGIVNYSVDATLNLREGADAALVLAAAQSNINIYTQAARLVGFAVPLSGIYAALHVEGVASVTLTTPSANVAVTAAQAAHCTGITLATA